MQGTEDEPGIIPRSLEKLTQLLASFPRSGSDSGSKQRASISFSFLEIYNEKVFDLLNPKNTDLPIREDKGYLVYNLSSPNLYSFLRKIFIPHLAEVPISTFEAFQESYQNACKNRCVIEGKPNFIFPIQL
jgi:kinesin family protein 22